MTASLLILIPIFAVFIPALMLPGPDFVGVVRASLTGGTRAGLLTTLGVTTGLGLYAALSLAGLSAIMSQYHWLAVAVRVAGGLYLVYLGIRLIGTRAAPIAVEVEAAAPNRPPHALRSYLIGLSITLTNPKAIVLFASVFAPAIHADTPRFVMAAIVALVMLSSLIWYTLVTLFMSSAPVMRRFRDAQHWIERIAGVSFVALGGKLIADARSPLPG